MAVKDVTKTVHKQSILTPEQIEDYNNWCRELNVSRQYYTRTHYYPNKWNRIEKPTSLLERIVSWIVK